MEHAALDRLHAVLPQGLYHGRPDGGAWRGRPLGYGYIALQAVPGTIVREGDIVLRLSEAEDRNLRRWLRGRWERMRRVEFPVLADHVDMLELVTHTWEHHGYPLGTPLHRYLTHKSALRAPDASSPIIVTRPVEPSEVSRTVRADSDDEAVRRLLADL